MQQSNTYFRTESPTSTHSSGQLQFVDVAVIISWVMLTNSIFFAIGLGLHRALSTVGLVHFNALVPWMETGRWFDIPLAAALMGIGWLWRYSVPKCLYRYEKTFEGDGLSELGHGIANGVSIYMLICFLVVSMSLFSSM